MMRERDIIVSSFGKDPEEFDTTKGKKTIMEGKDVVVPGYSITKILTESDKKKLESETAKNAPQTGTSLPEGQRKFIQ